MTQNQQAQELSRYERKRLEREEKDREREKAKRKNKLRNYGIGFLFIVVIVGGVVLLALRANKHATKAIGEHFSNQGQKHVEVVDVETYNSVPPTSGDHFASQTNWGIHKEPIPEGYQIHNLEHGGILMQYKPDIATDIIEKLKAIGEVYKWKKIILAPYPRLDKNIALTAWTRLDSFDDFDEARIRAFIDTHRNHGPENVPDNMQSVQLP